MKREVSRAAFEASGSLGVAGRLGFPTRRRSRLEEADGCVFRGCFPAVDREHVPGFPSRAREDLVLGYSGVQAGGREACAEAVAAVALWAQTHGGKTFADNFGYSITGEPDGLKVAVSGDGAEHSALRHACPVQPCCESSDGAMLGAAMRDANFASYALLICF